MRPSGAWLRFWVLVFALVVPRLARAETVEITGAEQRIGDRFELLSDPSGTMTAEDAARARFQPSGSLHPNLGFTRAAVWARVTLSNPRSQPADLVLDVAREWVDEVDVWRLEGGSPVHLTTTGARVPLRGRAIRVERAVVPIVLEGEATYLIRARTRGPLDLRLILVPRVDYLNADATGMLFFGGYYAVLFAIAAYSLILFANLRDRLQAGVAGVLVSYSLVEMCGHGHLSRLIPGGAGWFELDGLALAFAFFCPTITFVARDVSRARWRWLPVAGWVGAALCVIATLTGALALALVAVLLAVGATLVACAHALRARMVHAIQLTIAVGAFTIPMTVTLFTLVGWLPAHPVTEYGNHVGAVVMSVLLSLTVADSIRLARAELGQRATEVAGLNEELRFQVAARSRELVDVLARQADMASCEVVIRQGDTFEDRYRVESFIGQGGMGSVYEVERTSDGRRCALKVLTAARSGPEAARIAREAEIGARLVHPNLVQILDVGVARQGPYLVMELVRGGSLDAHHEQWGDPAWVLDVLRGTAAGLAALHRGNVVHRDLKPPNVLLDAGTPKLADFGIAHVGDGAVTKTIGLATTLDVAALARSPRLTEAHALIGTPLYMAPECALGAGAASSAADVFAFGVMALELLSKQHPFDELPVLAALAGRSHPPHRSASNVSARVAEALDACVVADAASRPDIDEVLRVLSD